MKNSGCSYIQFCDFRTLNIYTCSKQGSHRLTRIHIGDLAKVTVLRFADSTWSRCATRSSKGSEPHTHKDLSYYYLILDINPPSERALATKNFPMLTRQVNGVKISYDDAGYASGPAVVLLTGWAHDMALYDQMVPFLAPKHRTIRICWRGHGTSRDDIADFGVNEQVDDTIAMLTALGVDQFHLVSHSHGGWPALEIVETLGQKRVLSLLMIDQIMTSPPPAFQDGLAAMQSESTWREARQDLFNHWLAGSDNKLVHDHFLYNMSNFGWDMWALSCRVIANAYATHESPMKRMSKLQNPPPIRHVFSHPLDDANYRQLHVEFATKHPWFGYADLKGETHFPDIEIPDKVVAEIEDLIAIANKT